MRIIIDIEANGLVNPTEIWVVGCKDVDTGEIHVFRHVTGNPEEMARFKDFLQGVSLVVGHHIMGYDIPVLERLCGLEPGYLVSMAIDTLVVSKLENYSRANGHSIEDYGREFGKEKINFSDFSKYSIEMEEYCIRDVEITYLIYLKYLSYIEKQKKSIETEQYFQYYVINTLENNGFYVNLEKLKKLLENTKDNLELLDKDILEQYPRKLKLVKEITPRLTKYETLNRNDFRWYDGSDLSEFNGGPFCRCEWVDFNPSSHKQVVDVLHAAGWSPTDKTKTHLDCEREINRLKYLKGRSTEVDTKLSELYNRIIELDKYGFQINENNLSTLPPEAPPAARTLAQRILVESRRRTLTEWLDRVDPEDNRIHGKFYGIGAWTHRMAHQAPNMANIPNAYKEDGSIKLLGKEMRSLWSAPRKRLLVGVDAEGIQLRIFAHYINDQEFIDALVRGSKADKTDPHSLNQRVLGTVCKTRQAAKRFIYALLLGAGLGKLAQILDCSREESGIALERLLERYEGFARLKQTDIPKDASKGFFVGLDGRRVVIPGDTDGQRRHLCMSGYLQNGEAVVMKMASLKWINQLKDFDAQLVNFVHDEWQTECPNNMKIALQIAELQADSLRIVGEELGLRCPLAGSYWNEDAKDYTIGTNWSVTH